MIILRSISNFLICAVAVICCALNAHASVVFFIGQLDYIQDDTGGVYSGTPIGTDFVGSVDDDDANGFISDGDKHTSFGCCIAAGGLSVSNDMALTAEDAVFLNGIAGFAQFSEGDIVDSINIEGDKNTTSGGRIEIGITYILPSNSFDNEDLSNYPVEQNEIELALFFLFEEDDLGNDLYSAGGKIIGSSSSADFEYNLLLNGEYYGVNYFSDDYTGFVGITFDGDGGLTYQSIEDFDGSPLESGSGTYTVTSDGETSLTVASDDKRGIVSFDGQFAFFVDLAGKPGLDLMIKKSSGLSNSILNGEYYAINYFSDDYTDFTEAIFDGDGGFTYQTIKTSDGSPLESGSGTYTVASDGQIAIGDNKGVVSSDGKYIFTVDLAGIPGIVILSKKSNGLTTSILNGDYYSLNHFSDDFASFGEANFAGNGILNYRQIDSVNGPLDSVSGTYTVAPDGQVTIDGNRGMVSSDGRIVFLVDLSSNPGIDIFSKKFVTDDDNGGGAVVWVPLSGTVAFRGQPVCAMVLANGQYMFTNKPGSDFGKYELNVPLDANGEITIQAFVSGMAPFLQKTDTSDLDIDIAMQSSNPESNSPVVTTVVESNGSTPAGWKRITGTVTHDGAPLCSMVLANGQYMFSCGDNNGTYDLTVPLDSNGQITHYVFVSGFKPYKQFITP